MMVMWRWYRIPFALLAACIVWPDIVLMWLSDHFGVQYTHRRVAAVLCGACAVTAVLLYILMPAYPRLQWWQPLAYVFACAVVRVIHIVIIRIFDLDFWQR